MYNQLDNDEFDEINEDLSKFINENITIQENEREQQNEQIQDAAKILLDMHKNVENKFSKTLPYFFKKKELTQKQYEQLYQAYLYTLKLIDAHITMVMKDLHTDVAEYYHVPLEDIILITTYGDNAFTVKNEQQKKYEQ
jgi:hypothetical protein